MVRFTVGLAFMGICMACTPDAPVALAETGASTSSQVNAALGIGFNLGNTFDLSQHSSAPADVKPLIDLYAGAGAKHVRIPVTWGHEVRGVTLADRSGQVDLKSPRLAELKEVVDYAIGKDLYVIVNTHHEHWLKDTYDGSERFDGPFRRMWTGIATAFKDHSPKLIFEILNEPEKAMGDWAGPLRPMEPLAIERTRKINNVGLAAIRATGGANASRVVMFGVNGQGNHSMLKAVYPSVADLPGGGKDQFLIATVHTYDPWNFCGQDGSNQNWPGNGPIVSQINDVAAHAKSLGVPVNYGEYGVGRQSDQSSRNTDLVRGYYRLVTETALGHGMSVTPWDDRGWFGLTERAGDGSFRFIHGIVPSFLKP